MWLFAVCALCLISLMDLRVTADQQCKPAEASMNGKALKGHTFKTSVVGSLFECQVLCENELKCQSYNYFIPSKICELNDRTKETKPYSFVTDENSVYMKSWPNRVPLGSTPEMPAETCKEIKASEGGQAVSGKYWFDSLEPGEVVPANCDMEMEEINCFDYPVGVSSPAIIPDNQMTASSYTTTNHSSCRAYNGRLNDTRGDGWCSEVPDSNNDWLQIDFKRIIQVCAVATQGDVRGNGWVTDFKLSYSSVGNVWTTYKDVNGADQVFHRQGKGATIDQHKLPITVSAKYIRFHPTNRHKWNCLRVEAYSNHPPECQGYQNLTSFHRKTTLVLDANDMRCDRTLGPGWFRFQGDAGSKMPTSCVLENHCGTNAPGWLNSAHPTVAEGLVSKQVCFNWLSNCCYFSINIQVRNCGSYFVYFINGTPPSNPCYLVYCGTD